MTDKLLDFWQRLIGRKIRIYSYESPTDTDYGCMLIVDYDKKTGVYKVIDELIEAPKTHER